MWNSTKTTDISLKELSKKLKSKFSCGCSVVTGEGNQGEIIALQGDFLQEIVEELKNEYKIPVITPTPSGEIVSVPNLQKLPTRPHTPTHSKQAANSKKLCWEESVTKWKFRPEEIHAPVFTVAQGCYNSELLDYPFFFLAF